MADPVVPLLEVDQLVKRYRLPRERLWQEPPQVTALAGVSFTLQRGRNLGVVGESGCGKSTLARLVMALEAPSQGRVLFDGQDLARLPAARLQALRAGFQMVFQDPHGSLDPRQTVARIVGEPLELQPGVDAAERRRRVAAALDAVGLAAADAGRYPHEFSGGQRQRIAIARALVTRPALIVADEPVSALDVSVQAQVLNLMQDLQDEFGLSYLFISHDLAVVDLVSDEVIVLYQGRIVEQGSPEQLFRAAAHPYTRTLMAAVPQVGGGGQVARAVPLSPASPVSPLPVSSADIAVGGCPFAPRCRFRQDACARAPALAPVPGAPSAHLVACHRAADVLAAG